MTNLIHELIFSSSVKAPAAVALKEGGRLLDYQSLSIEVALCSNLYLSLGLRRLERVAVYMEKRIDTVAALFGAAAAGGVFVPVNPLLKPEQVSHILNDGNVRILVTSAERLE